MYVVQPQCFDILPERFISLYQSMNYSQYTHYPISSTLPPPPSFICAKELPPPTRQVSPPSAPAPAHAHALPPSTRQHTTTTVANPKMALSAPFVANTNYQSTPMAVTANPFQTSSFPSLSLTPQNQSFYGASRQQQQQQQQHRQQHVDGDILSVFEKHTDYFQWLSLKARSDINDGSQFDLPQNQILQPNYALLITENAPKFLHGMRELSLLPCVRSAVVDHANDTDAGTIFNSNASNMDDDSDMVSFDSGFRTYSIGNELSYYVEDQQQQQYLQYSEKGWYDKSNPMYI